MARMNESVKARWVAALRSGEYKQTRQTLKDRDGHCCLGVLCDLFAKESGRKRWDKQTLSDLADCTQDHPFGSWFMGDESMPCITVYIWAGLDPDRDVRIAGRSSYLHFHNDDGRTFAEIADAIEAQL